MKKFDFRLKRVLDYRQLVKKESERDFAKKTGRLRTLEQELDEIIEAQDKALFNPKQRVTMAEFSLVEQYQERLQEELAKQRQLVESASKEVEEARQVYIEKSIETSILENLKDKKLEDYKLDTRREERKDLNEMTVQRYRLPKPGGKKKEE